MSTVRIPPDLPFSALQLARDSTGDVSFSTDAIGAIERASGLPDGHFMGQSEDALGGLIVQWYAAHLAAGGERDPVADDLIGEVAAEDARGGGMSHQPWRA